MIAAALLALVLAALPQTASAQGVPARPRCPAASLDEAAILRYDAIFEVRILQHFVPGEAELPLLRQRNISPTGVMIYQGSVEEPWKGTPRFAVVYFIGDVTMNPPLQDGQLYLIAAQRFSSGYYALPPCSLAASRDDATRELAVLRSYFGGGDDIKITARDQACQSDSDCARISTSCQPCSCGTAVARIAVPQYIETYRGICRAEQPGAICDFTCTPTQIKCVEGNCELVEDADVPRTLPP
jgi:hypothetical protein